MDFSFLILQGGLVETSMTPSLPPIVAPASLAYLLAKTIGDFLASPYHLYRDSTTQLI